MLSFDVGPNNHTMIDDAEGRDVQVMAVISDRTYIWLKCSNRQKGRAHRGKVVSFSVAGTTVRI